ncbi:uncharacterized protein YuxK [Filimonas sp.]|nr:uncharacterized protein YuxK [Filimonas sp.]
MNEKIILFDGVCNFCNFWVKFAGKRDGKKVLKFAPLQSETGQTLLRKNGISTDKLSTVVFLDDGKVYTQSGAAFRICKYLDGIWKLGYVFIIIPKPLRDYLYNLIGRNRYRWFGKSDSCMLPTADMKDRFL